MKVNKLSIEINRPVVDVFLYTINPKNTPKWIPGIVEEQASQTISVGTKYRNKDHGGRWSEYVVTELVLQKIFELTSKDGNYHARYSFEGKGPALTELTYTEWVDVGGIPILFSPENLEKLKKELEK